MSREAHIPLALWISAALVAHLAGGGSAVQVAKIVEDRKELRALVSSLREGLRPADTTFEVLTEDALPTPSPQAAAPPAKDADPSESDPTDEPAPPDPAAPKAKADPNAAKVTAAPTADPPKDPPPPPEAPPPEVVAKVEPPPVVPVEPTPPQAPPPADKRIAVRQHVQKDQEDNPTASRIADDANHTTDETVARTRSYDQDDPNPTPGAHAGPKGEIGDGSDHDKVGHAEDKKGNEEHAPGEAKKSSTSTEHQNPTPPSPAPGKVATAAPPSVPGTKGGGKAPGLPPAPPVAPPSAGGAGPASPEVALGDQGYALDPANPGGDGKSKSPGRRRAPAPYQPPVRVGSIGLGAPGVIGGPNINLTMSGVEAAVGHEKLKAERAADGASRRSAHRGSWEGNKFEKWRAAIENYEPSVKLGNQTSLNAARVPFATYINGIHNRLHPIFAEEFLASLDALPPSHSLNQELVTHVEIVLSKDEGRIVRMGITRASGVTAFDVVALNSISRAAPYGKSPEVIVSPDGNVYLHWEFHRDPFDACTTRNARPFMLKNAPTLTPTPAPPRKAPLLKPGDDAAAVPGPLVPLRAP